MEKAIKDYLLNQADFNNLYKSKKKNDEVADTFVFIIMNEDISEWSTLFSEYEIRDIQMIMRDHKINMILD